jgi:DNA-binding CsgD family transcriptional regulator
VRLLLDAGVSVAEVARRTGVPYTVVRHERDRRGGGDGRGPVRPDAAVEAPRLHSSTGDEVERLLTAGHTRAEIARRLDVSRATVTYHARRLGMPIDHRAARRYDLDLSPGLLRRRPHGAPMRGAFRLQQRHMVKRRQARRRRRSPYRDADRGAAVPFASSETSQGPTGQGGTPHRVLRRMRDLAMARAAALARAPSHQRRRARQPS